ncbi:Ankyrin repeat-containing protein ITN1 [Camellia lanceoleosa]|uniref:Ankyrin repeat-containing protein ITN1 n=1 Tax=Camellia lanceoleosa TaxID=1840588 RepID=A0ACC0GN05_9ERIC|nr:Ankyrin repeat-containing protein ITN1 [Camellia lanceoleosa]
MNEAYTKEAIDEYYKQCVPLYNAALEGVWEAANSIIEKHPTVVRARITEGWETALHIATTRKHIHFVKELVPKMTQSDLEMTNKKGCTALCFAALDGTVAIAKVMVDKNDKLPDICGNNGVNPLYMAALSGKRDMVQFLYERTKVRDWNWREKVKLLNTCISTSLLDTALRLIDEYPTLTVAKDRNSETALHVLARKPSIFAARNHPGIWSSFIKCKNSTQTLALKLTDCLIKNIFHLDNLNITNIIEEAPKLLFAAAYSGNTEFLIRLLQSFPDLIWTSDQENQTIFHVAVRKRDEKIFKLLHEIGSAGKVIATKRDVDDNNMLHLAANFAPPCNISGAALQMQHEILWFKEVEKNVQPLYIEMKNSDGKTPQDLFTENHKELIKEAKQWMKDIANSSIIFATLIATVIFTAAFTVPSNTNNKSDVPISLKKRLFGVLSISEGVALSFSTISILMFLSILSSRYAEGDFLRSLPLKLVLGMMTLFISMAAMMVAFCTTFFLYYQHGLIWINVVFTLIVPVLVMYVLLKCPLLLDIIQSTHRTRTLFRPCKRLFDSHA